MLQNIKQSTIYNKDGKEEESATVMEQFIYHNTVMIFTKSYCPFCKRVKAFFTDKRVAFTSLDMDLMGTQGAEIQTLLKERTGQSTVPSVWVFGKFIGKGNCITKNTIQNNLVKRI